jgi:hypothetical protein
MMSRSPAVAFHHSYLMSRYSSSPSFDTPQYILAIKNMPQRSSQSDISGACGAAEGMSSSINWDVSLVHQFDDSGRS